jgi:hypothetical protein
LIVNADAELPLALASQCLEPVVGWDSQIVKASGPMHHRQLALCHGADVGKSRNRLAGEKVAGGTALERTNHKPMIYRPSLNQTVRLRSGIMLRPFLVPKMFHRITT